MIVPGSASPLLTTTDGGYTIAKSLRFRSSASAYLNRTPGSVGNRKTWTWSGWVKLSGSFGSAVTLFSCGNTGTNLSTGIQYSGGTNGLQIYDYTTGYNFVVDTVAFYRDPSAWYHVVVAMDTTQATAANRTKVYVNGSQVSITGSSVYPTQNTDYQVNNTVPQNIGKFSQSSAVYFDGYMADVYLIDGQQLTPSSFGETDSLTGVWKPKAYSGTYGTNGFYLKFTDVATTSGSNAGLGKDFSGNGNYWNTNNISVTSGVTYDSMKDVPTLTDTDTANYCVLNPLDATTPAEVTNGNLSFGGGTNVRGTMGGFGSGKYYYEYTKTNASSSPNFGRCGAVSNTAVLGSMTAAGTVYRSDGLLYENDVNVATYASFTTNDVIGVAINCDSSELSFYKNNTLQGTRSFPTGLTASNVTPALRNNTGQTSHVNFGQRPFAYTPPTGYKALNTYNLE